VRKPAQGLWEGSLRLTTAEIRLFSHFRAPSWFQKIRQARKRSDAAILAATLRVTPVVFSNISFVSDIAFVAIDAHN
jgi:hypothetical protein